MYEKPTTWGDVWQYGYVKDKAGETWKILEEKAGWIRLQNRAGEIRDMMRPDPAAPVTAVLSTWDEALAAIHRVFPGSQIITVTRETGEPT